MKTINSFFVYTFLMIILPNGIGFRSLLDFYLWMILAILLIIPPLLKEVKGNYFNIETFDLVILALVALDVFATFFNQNMRAAVADFIAKSMYFIVPYFAGKYLIKSEKSFLSYVIVLNCAALVVSIMALYEMRTGNPFFQRFSYLMMDPDNLWMNSQMLYERFGSVRVAASFAQPIFLGVFLSLVVLMNFIIIQERLMISKNQKAIIYCVIIFAVIGVVVSQSRTAAICLILTSITYWFDRRQKIGIARLFVFTVPVFASVWLIYFLLGQAFDDLIFYSIFSPDAPGGLIGRSRNIADSFYMIFSYPNWLGEKIVTKFDYYWFLSNTDLLNGYLNKFLLKGIFCGIVYTYVWFKAIKGSYQLSKDTLVGKILFYSFLYLAVVNWITWVVVQNEILFFVLLGLMVNPFLKHSMNNSGGNLNESKPA
ncbi:MAG: hypothetical protein NTV58_17840 [Deltaproteobacteria bacterium]|nr:hypothetical protein [Deltaproteobacteria bacterium]